MSPQMALPTTLQVQLGPSNKLFVAWAALAMCTTIVRGAGQVRAPNTTDEFIAGHNRARAEVGVKPLRWSEKLATLASRLARYQRDKESCGFAGKDLGFGSNQEQANYKVSPSQVVEAWVSEKKFYNHSDNTCAPNHMCGVYTQVVWNTSLELGCAQVSCTKAGLTTLTICLYNPPGNYQGQSPY